MLTQRGTLLRIAVIPCSQPPHDRKDDRGRRAIREDLDIFSAPV